MGKFCAEKAQKRTFVCFHCRCHFVVTELKQQKRRRLLLFLESYFPHGLFAMQSNKNIYGDLWVVACCLWPEVEEGGRGGKVGDFLKNLNGFE